MAHECGHAVVAWLSPAVAEVAGISFHRDGSAATLIAFRARHPELPVESALVHLGGMAGEVLVWERIRSGGFSSDLRKAIGSLETYLKAAPVTALEARWRGRLAASSIDVAMMMAERPQPDVAAALNLCYRRAKYLLIEHRPAFLRLVALATRIGDLTADDIATQFGPRIWDRLR